VEVNRASPPLIAALGLLAAGLVAWLLWPAAPTPTEAPTVEPAPAQPTASASAPVAPVVTSEPSVVAGKRPVDPAVLDDPDNAPTVEADPPPDPVSLPIVPREVRMSRREALGSTNGLRTALLHYQRDNGAWPAPGGPCPPEPPAGEAVAWEGPCTAAFDAIDWAPPLDDDGVPTTRCSYEFEIVAEDTGRGGGDFRVIARCDGDGDGEVSETMATRHGQARRQTADEVY